MTNRLIIHYGTFNISLTHPLPDKCPPDLITQLQCPSRIKPDAQMQKRMT